MNRELTLRVEKWAIWCGLVLVLFLLRHLFPIFFLTFVLSYIGNTAVDWLAKRSRHRKLNVAAVYLTLLLILFGVALLIVPRMINEARDVARQYITSEAAREESGQTFARRQAHEFVDGFVIGVAGTETLQDFQKSDAYIAIVGRIESGLATASKRMTPR